MHVTPVTNTLNRWVLLFPAEWVKAALVLALISIWVVIAFFFYLNRATKKPYFQLWTVSWMFYSIYLTAAIGLEESPNMMFLAMARRACIGISALFMFWGSFELTNHGRDRVELGSATVMMLIWSYIAAFRIRQQLWVTAPVFVLLAGAGVYTGVLYWARRKRSQGGTILAVGFTLWGPHLLAFPFLESSPALATGAYLTSAVLAMLIALGMVVEHQVILSEANYSTLFDSASDAMFLIDYESFRILEANPSAQRMLKRSATELAGQDLMNLFPELKENAVPTANGQSPPDRESNPRRELRLPQSDGEFLVYEASANLIFGPRGPVMLLDARDVTERNRAAETLRDTAKRLETALAKLRATQHQVVQQERLHALEKMASGVAHDFNNALAKILGFNELLLSFPENLNDKEKVKKYLQMMNAAALDAVKIVNRLREFYRHRKDTDVYQAVDLAQVVEQAIVLTQPKWKDQAMAAGVTVKIELNWQEVPQVRGSASELREIVINLIFNAVDAMPEGGTITIGSRANENGVMLSVTDTGVGMTEEVRQRCLEPFFTTKHQQGTGLGLAIVYGIIQRHGGTIEIESELGKGTTLSVGLPIHDMQEAPPAPGATTPRFHPLNILLVEDEPLIRDIEAEYLRSDGHTVTTATTGKEALKRFHTDRFDLVVADRAMPEMNGDQMTEAIKSSSPQTPVIMVTGFADMQKEGGRKTGSPDLVLRKPITQSALHEAITKVTAAFKLEHVGKS